MDHIPTDQHIEDAKAILAALPWNRDGDDQPDHENILIIATELANRERRGIGGNAPPGSIDPENMLRLPPVDIPDLLALSYRDLIGRGAALLENVTAWQQDNGKVPVPDQQAADDLADLQDQVAKYGNPKTGEVEAARKRVKEPIYLAGKAVDTFFNDLRNAMLAIAGLEPYGAGPATMQGKLSAWQRAKVVREQAERAELARKANEEAAAKVAAARVDQSDEALIDATVAEETAQQAQQAAAAPARDMARSTTARGTTVGLRANWTFRVVDLEILILAAALPAVMERLSGVMEITQAGLLPKIRAALAPPGGPVPLDYLTTNDAIIRPGIKGERGRRECPGLEIFNDAQASRRSGS
jgi:hypothetical protein